MENVYRYDRSAVDRVGNREDGVRDCTWSSPADLTRASSWVQAEVLPDMTWRTSPRFDVAPWAQMALSSTGEVADFWADLWPDYEWVLLCQLFGLMISLPQGWPMFCMDLKQLAVSLGDPRLPKRRTLHHRCGCSVGCVTRGCGGWAGGGVMARGCNGLRAEAISISARPGGGLEPD